MANSGFNVWRVRQHNEATAALWERVHRFRNKHPDITITRLPGGSWEVYQPGETAAAWEDGVTMMDNLERRYPDER